jgi:hypothetical protein
VSRQRLWLVRVQGECFAAVAEGATAASSLIEFVRAGTGPATHLATGGRLFARLDPPPP